MAKVLTKKGAAVRSQAMMYKVVVHTVLLYGSKSWVVKVVLLTVIEGFYHWVAGRVLAKTARCARDKGCKLQPVEEALEVSDQFPIKE